MENYRHLKQESAQRIEADLVLTRTGELAQRNLNIFSRSIFSANSLDAIVFSGLNTSVSFGITVSVERPAYIIQKHADGEFSHCADGGSPELIALDTADTTNPRIDIVQARVVKKDAFLDASTDFVDPVTKNTFTQPTYRDKEIYLEITKKTGTAAPIPTCPSTDAATAATYTGVAVVSDPIDLSTNYLLYLSVGYDENFITIDLRGATPSATTRAEILSNLNAAGFGTIAAYDGSWHLILSDPNPGPNSRLILKQPPDYTKDAAPIVLGGTWVNGYTVIQTGSAGYFKVAEISVPANTVTLTPDKIIPISASNLWTVQTASTVIMPNYEDHRSATYLDHPDDSVHLAHLASDVLTQIQNIVVNADNNSSSPMFNDQGERYTVTNPGTNFRLVQFWPTTAALTRADGTALTYADVESSTPYSRVDQVQETVGGGTYNCLTLLSELAADRIPFTPTPGLLFAENHNRVGLYINTIGTGYTGLRIHIHDAANNDIATLSTPIGSLVTGWNYFNLTATLVPGNTYHYHVYVEGFTSGTTTILETDGANIAFREMYLPDAGLYGIATEVDAAGVLDGALAYLARITADTDTGYKGETSVEVMAVDFSDPADWLAWSYNNYIGIDPFTGRIKFSNPTLTVTDIASYFGKWNLSRSLAQLNGLALKYGYDPDAAKSVAEKIRLVESFAESVQQEIYTLQWDYLPVGFMANYPGASVPSAKYLIRDGSLISRTTYVDLFNLLMRPVGATFLYDLSTITTGSAPVALDSDGTYIWVANYSSGTVTRITIADSTTTTITVGTNPVGIYADGTYTWVANATSNNVTRITVADSTTTTITAGSNPEAIDSDGTYVFVANYLSGSVTRITIADSTTTTITVGTNPRGLVISGGYVWVSNAGSANVTRITIADSTTTNIAVGANPRYPVIDGTYVWVPNTGANSITRILVADSTTSTFPLGITGLGRVAADGTYVWATHDNGVIRLNATTGSTTDIPLGIGRSSIVSDTNYVWAVSSSTFDVYRISKTDLSISFIDQNNTFIGIIKEGNYVWAAAYDSNFAVKFHETNINLVVTASPHNFIPGDVVQFETTGSLAGTGLTLLTDYWVRAPVSANSFEISVAIDGPTYQITGPGTGSHTILTTSIAGSGDGSTTFSLPDDQGIFERGSGVSSTFMTAGGDYFSGGAPGYVGLDQIQGFQMQIWDTTSSQQMHINFNATTTGAGTRIAYAAGNDLRARIFEADGYGTPRIGNQTQPVYRSYLPIIKVI